MAVLLQTLDPVTLTLSNNPYPISSFQFPIVSVTISADATNTGRIYIGDSTVTPANGIDVGPGESALISTPLRPSGSEEFHLDEIFVTTSTAGSKIRISAWRRRP